MATLQQHIELPDIRSLLPRTVERGGGGGGGEAFEFPGVVRALLGDPSLDETLGANREMEAALEARARDIAARAYPASRTTDRDLRWIDHESRDAHHRALLAIYQQHMRLPHHGVSVNQFHPLACRLMRSLEEPWERAMLARARAGRDLSAEALPADPDGFVAWYRDTAFAHPLYEHELYSFLASEASRGQIEWFLRMESAGEAAFDDFLAMAQVGTRGEVKMEMASNYWDEMGKGKPHAVHTYLFHHLAAALAIATPEAHELPWQVLSGINVMLWSCIARRNAFRALGVLGAVELLAPQRCTRLVHGALRVGITKKAMTYYGAHAIIDVGHAEGWLAHVIRAQVSELPEARTGIAEGLLVRADASLDYFDWCLARARALNA